MSEMKEIRLPQGPVRYRERGTGEPIVLVHGLLANGELWGDVIPLLARENRVIAPDWPLGSQQLPLQPGADMTPPGIARLLADFLEALELEHVTLVGNDTGGALCQLVAVEHPARVARVVLTNCDAYEHFPPPEFGLLMRVGSHASGLYATAQAMRSAAARRRPEAYGMLMKQPRDQLTAEWMRPLRESAEIRRQTAAFIAAMDPRHTLAAAARFPQLELPFLLAWAPEDPFFRLANAERMVAELPHARLELIDDSLAFVSLDQPRRTAELISAFAREPMHAAA